ncbi:hypothetical protein BDD12DRAFT_354030, partial [Trichophaea hybrida]
MAPKKHLSNPSGEMPSINGATNELTDLSQYVIAGPQTRLQWITHFTLVAREIKQKNPHLSRLDRTEKVFELLMGCCENQDVFDSFVTFQDEYYRVHDHVAQQKKIMHERNRQRSSTTSTIGDEVVRHFALDTLDIAISIVNQNQDHGGSDSI